MPVSAGLAALKGMLPGAVYSVCDCALNLFDGQLGEEDRMLHSLLRPIWPLNAIVIK